MTVKLVKDKSDQIHVTGGLSVARNAELQVKAQHSLPVLMRDYPVKWRFHAQLELV